MPVMRVREERVRVPQPAVPIYVPMGFFRSLANESVKLSHDALVNESVRLSHDVFEKSF
jgi:hypothetical protein